MRTRLALALLLLASPLASPAAAQRSSTGADARLSFAPGAQGVTVVRDRIASYFGPDVTDPGAWLLDLATYAEAVHGGVAAQATGLDRAVFVFALHNAGPAATATRLDWFSQADMTAAAWGGAARGEALFRLAVQGEGKVGGFKLGLHGQAWDVVLGKGGHHDLLLQPGETRRVYASLQSYAYASAAPEPASLLLIGSGLGLAGLVRRRRLRHR